MTLNEIIAQIFGLLLIILTFLSPQMKSRNGILLFILLANLASCVQFYFVSAIAGLYALIVTTVRSLVYWIYANKEKQAHISIFIFFVIMQIGATIIGWQNWWSSLTLVLILNTYGQWQKDENRLRLCLLISSLFLGIYCFYVHAYTGAINKWLQTFSTAIAILKFKQANGDKN